MEPRYMTFKTQRLWLVTVTASVFSLLATSAFAELLPSHQTNPIDPYEPFNRVMFRFNDAFDKVILKPVATLYSKIMPKPLAKGISNFFSNIDTVPTVINDVLQMNIYQATSDAWRLTLNTTVGIGGLFDVASEMGLERNSEDFGLTLARWGYQLSNYLVIPFLGPSTVRDTVAWPINYRFMTIYPFIHPTRARYELYVLSVVSKRADYLRFQEVMQQAAIDKYVFIRDAYMQRRAYQIERNKQLDDPYLDQNSLIDKNNYIKTNAQ
jgi:phospholipid-binding lipoprotein MlaA